MNSTFTKLLAFCLLLIATGSSAQLMFPGSSILDSYEDGRIATWVESQFQYQATLLYDKQVGDQAADWHAAVDGVNNTICVIETTNGFIFGGFHEGAWDGAVNGYYDGGYDGNFLYSVNNNAKWPIRPDRLDYAVFNRNIYGPTFGGGHDLHITNNLQQGYTYSWAYAPEGSTYEGQTDIFGGTYNSWTIQSMEVWALNTSGVAVPEYTIGCADPLACNYDPTADYNDDSCDFESCYGCQDPASCNYDENATFPDFCDYISCNPCTGLFLDGTDLVDVEGNNQLAAWLGSDFWYEPQLIYDSDVHGLGATNFHTNCDGVQGTLVVIRTDDGYVFGGYNHGTWQGPTSGYYEAGYVENFLFSINNNLKWSQDPSNLLNGTYNRANYGPTFGGGHDLYLNQGMTSGYTFAFTYGDPTFPVSGSHNYLAGSYNNWTVDAVEVWNIRTSGTPWGQDLGGCMDPAACNYDPGASCDNGLCDYSGGCQDSMACNYDPDATCDDGSCEYTSCVGCTDAVACNYSATATNDDGSCEYLSCQGCTDAGACNYDGTATQDDGSCEYLSCAGCMDAAACNYDGTATIDDMSCEYLSCQGCTDMTACEYDPTATVDDGSCLTYPGNACDDGNDLTVNDTVQGDCSCQGIVLDPDVLPTQCDYPSGVYDRCDMIKADWVNADDYRFVFEPADLSGPALVHEQGAANTFLLLSEVYGLEVGQTYNVFVDAGYDLGLSTMYWEPGTVSVSITIVVPTTAVNPADDCAMSGPRFLGDYISANAFVCGADHWVWTFQATGEMPIEFIKPGAGRYVRLSAVQGLVPGQTYEVTAQAGYPEGSLSNAGAPVCIQLIGEAPGAAQGPELESNEMVEDRAVEGPSAAIYPNPNRGDFLVINLGGVAQERVPVTIYNLSGQVAQQHFVNAASGSVQETLTLDGLAAGTYVVHVGLDKAPVQLQLVVTP